MSEIKSKPPAKKKGLIILIVAVVVIGVIAIASSGSDEPSLVNNGTSETSTNGGDETDNRTEFVIGDVIAWEGQEITVVSVERDWQSGNQFITPSAGNEFVNVNVRIENKSNRNISFNPFDWRIQNSNGAIEGHSWAASADDSLGSGELVPGGNRTGSIMFEVPQGDDGLILHYSPGFWTNRTVQIHLRD